MDGMNERGPWPARLEAGVQTVARLSLAAVFWVSGQTKVEGLVLDPLGGELALGWPRLAPSALALFRDEYRLPLLAPEWAALAAASAEHLLPLLLVLGLGTRLAAAGLLVMTLVIQFLVYPGAWPTHGVWAAALGWLMLRGPGPLALDRWLALPVQRWLDRRWPAGWPRPWGGGAR